MAGKKNEQVSHSPEREYNAAVMLLSPTRTIVQNNPIPMLLLESSLKKETMIMAESMIAERIEN